MVALLSAAAMAACTSSRTNVRAATPDSSVLAPTTAAVSGTASSSAPPTSAPVVASTTTVTTVPSLADLYRTVESGVLRIQASTCDGSGIGTGFLVASDQLVTAAHVVAGAVSLVVDTGGGDPVPGTVEGSDATLDVALIRLRKPMQGYAFQLSANAPAPGTTVAAIGFPFDQPKTLTRGTVSGVERTV